MLDETIKQIVLKFKVDDQANFGDVQKKISGLNEAFAKSIPSREATEFLRISEKIGGEFQKVAQSMNAMRMTQLKTDLRDINQQMGDLQKQLREVDQQVKTSSLAGDAAAYSAATSQRDKLMGQISSMGGQREAIQGAIGSQPSRLRTRLGQVSTAAQVAGFGGELYGGAEQLAGYKMQAVIENRLSRMESYSAEVKRNQEILYGGDALRAMYYARNQNLATNMAVADVTGARRQLYGQMVGQYSGVTGAGVQGAMQGALAGLPGGAPGMFMSGAAGAISGAGRQVLSAERTRFELGQFDAGTQARILEQRREFQERLMQSDPNYYLNRMVMDRARGYARGMETAGMTMGQFGDIRRLSAASGIVTPEEALGGIQSMTGQMSGREARLAAGRGIGMMRAGAGSGTFQERTRFAAAVAGTGRGGDLDQTMAGISNAFADPGLNLAYQRVLTGNIEASPIALSPALAAARTAGSLAAIEQSGTTGMRAIAGLQHAAQIPEMMNQAGTLENQLMRTAIRGSILGAGLKGGMAVSVENYISQMSLQELNDLPKNKQLLRVLGLNEEQARNITQSARQGKANALSLSGADSKLISAVQSGKMTPTQMGQISLIESGGGKMSVEAMIGRGAFLQSDISGRTRMTRGGAGARGVNPIKGLAEAQGAGQATLEEDIMNQVSSGQLSPAEAQKAMNQAISGRKGDVSFYKGMVEREAAGFGADTNRPMANAAQDVKSALSDLTSALTSAALQIRRSFGSAGKTVSTK